MRVRMVVHLVFIQQLAVLDCPTGFAYAVLLFAIELISLLSIVLRQRILAAKHLIWLALILVALVKDVAMVYFDIFKAVHLEFKGDFIY